MFKVSNDTKVQQEMAEAIYSRLAQLTQQFQEEKGGSKTSSQDDTADISADTLPTTDSNSQE